MRIIEDASIAISDPHPSECRKSHHWEFVKTGRVLLLPGSFPLGLDIVSSPIGATPKHAEGEVTDAVRFFHHLTK